MEEWIGRQWHRFITRAAEGQHVAAAVHLPEVERSLGLLFRAGGGAPGLKLATAGATRTGGPRGWLQQLAGSGTHSAVGQCSAQAWALPPTLAVFDDAALNRALYLWLAALAAHMRPHGDWLHDNLDATARALLTFPGLAETHARLVRAQLALRPAGAAIDPAEARVRAALTTGQCASGIAVQPAQVAPVWLWLDTTEALGVGLQRPDTPAPPGAAGAAPGRADRQRRRAEAVADERDKAPLMMFFRAESILSWGEFVKVNRATDDDENDQAQAVADDLDRLAIAADGQTSAARVKFDLDLPSAAADDRPLGPGLLLPEWDWRQGRLLPAHCAVQVQVARDTPPWPLPPALRRTARQVRRRMEVLRAAPGRAHGQPDGEEIDLDAWVRHRVEASSGASRSDSPAVYQRRVRSERSLATLLLADLSLSTDAHASDSARVIDVIRDALQVFGEALHAGGDAFEMLGFSSVRRQHVRIQHLKGFGEPWAAPVRDRIGAIKPGYYTRMGAAIRLATLHLQDRPERQRLLLLLTDGKPNDLDVYEGRYGLEDTRHAVQAARAAGLTPFCVSIDPEAQDYLPHLFGQHGHVRLQRPQELVQRLTAVHAALTRDR
jgi:nitric oxide reductase NorD protein